VSHIIIKDYIKKIFFNPDKLFLQISSIILPKTVCFPIKTGKSLTSKRYKMELLTAIWLFLKPGFIALDLYVRTKLGGAFIPAFFIAGAIGTWVPKHVVIRYLSAGTRPLISYSVSLVAGGLLSVCACGILPLFQTIYQRGAGIGPSFTFLFAGPAINIIAIFYTFNLLGPALGVARILCVAFLAVGTGLLFSQLFKNSTEKDGTKPAAMALIKTKKPAVWPKWIIFILLMIMVMTLPVEGLSWNIKGTLNLTCLLLVVILAFQRISREERAAWGEKSWFLIRQIVPKLLLGIFIIGLLESQSNHLMLTYLADGSNSFTACLLSALIGAILYLGTILGVVAVDGLTRLGLGAGPALALLLAGPTIALPSMFAIISICGKKKGLLFCLSVIISSALCGYIFGIFHG
jgi:uncharacterized membrane protein YraQ (UPF0718 family)